MATSKKSTLPVKRVIAKGSTDSSTKASAKPRSTACTTAACTCVKPAPAVADKVSAAAVATPPKTASSAKRVTFAVRADPGSQVSLAGDFNQWDAAANSLVDPFGTGNFSTVLMLAPGSYEYKFVINGIWCVDPECTEWVQNNLGTLNSVRKV